MNIKTALIAIDLHHKNSVIGHMNQTGKYFGDQQVKTAPKLLIRYLLSVKAERKCLTIEEGNLTAWMASKLKPYVDRLVICDPRKNSLISASTLKNDHIDTRRLCQLLRMDALTPVYNDGQMGHRRLFYWQIKQYEQTKKKLVIAKRQLTAGLRHWGYNVSLDKSDYRHPRSILNQVTNQRLREELNSKFEEVNYLAVRKQEQLDRIVEAGKQYPEISEFQKMAGAGPVTAHMYSGYIQNPHRFSTEQELIKFCQLAIRKHSSDGKTRGAEKLSKKGHSSLKYVSNQIFSHAVGRNKDNEVNDFYLRSCKKSNNETNARLNTQRKIIKTFWIIWKNKSTYDPTRFYRPQKGESTH